MTLTYPTKGGPAGAVSIDSSKRTIGRVAMNVYLFDTPEDAAAAGYRCEAGPAMPIYEVSDAELAAGDFIAEGDPKASAVYIAPAGMRVEGQYAIPVVVVNP